MRAAYYEDDMVTLHHGDALEVARTLPSASARTIVTSPPYFGLRDYGHEDQLGAESTVQEYVRNLVALFRELRRVLTDDGTLWLNLGDSYAGSWGAQGRDETLGAINKVRDASAYQRKTSRTGSQHPGEPPAKNLLGIPWRVAFALQDDGWILRSDIIWSKPNPMPESVTDRPTKAHEYLFLLAKSPRYFYDAGAIAERATGSQSLSALSFDRATKEAVVPGQSTTQHRRGRGGPKRDSAVRNRRDVWAVPTAPFGEAHFAVYPPELIRPCILAGSSPGDVVLDPFSGSGTTGMVATFEGRKYIGIDLNREYLDLSLRTRFVAPTLGVEAV